MWEVLKSYKQLESEVCLSKHIYLKKSLYIKIFDPKKVKINTLELLFNGSFDSKVLEQE
jgi:hypothetical protein